MTNNGVFIIIHVVAYKERQPVDRKVIRHGKDKGIIDMSIYPAETKTPQGGEVNLEELLKEVREGRSSNARRRNKE